MYEMFFSSVAERYFKKLKEKQLLLKYRTALKIIKENPYIGQVKHGDLTGIYCYDVYYNKINYEIAYSIHEIDGKKIVVILAGNRENFYKDLKRLTK